VAEKIRTTIERHVNQLEGVDGISTTISVGINTIVPKQDDSIHDFVSDVDKALYRAKREGKNRISIVRRLQKHAITN
jgi:diguanylate cyclase (GGDEF)-like protein